MIDWIYRAVDKNAFVHDFLAIFFQDDGSDITSDGTDDHSEVTSEKNGNAKKAEDADADETSEKAAAPVKRGRGRPPRNGAATASPKGKPAARKAKDPSSEEDYSAEESDGQEESDASSASGKSEDSENSYSNKKKKKAAKPAKAPSGKRRGRPPGSGKAKSHGKIIGRSDLHFLMCLSS